MLKKRWNVSFIFIVFLISALSTPGSPAQTEVACDFVSGSGDILTPSGAKGSFGLAAGLKNGAFFGHLVYRDRGIGLKFKSKSITAYSALDAKTRLIEGTLGKNSAGASSFRLTVTDNGNPGFSDIFDLELDTGYSAGGNLVSGNIKIEEGNAKSKGPSGSTCQSTDETAPSVAITSPSNGSTVSGTISITADASDDVGVSGVQFKVDGVNVGGEDTQSPYSVSWDTTTAADGSHTLTAVARDAAGNTTTSAPVSVTVSNAAPPDSTPPTVTITSPSNGSTVSGTTSVTANASDNVGVAGVQFKVDGVNVGSEDTTAPYSVSWDTTTSANGSHTLTAVARDTSGNTTTSAAVTVTVSNSEPPPGGTTRIEEDDLSVNFTGCCWTHGSTALDWSGGTASLTNGAGHSATLSFNGTGVSWISFRGPQAGIANVVLDGVSMGSVDLYSPSQELQAVVFTRSGLASGAHTLTIESTGNKNASASDAFVVVDAFDVTSEGGTGDTTPPAVSITSPANGATVSDTISVTANASDDTGVAGVQFKVDGVNIGAEDTTAPYSVDWDTTTVENGSHTLTAVARDAAGNIGTSSPVTVTVSNDAPPPPGETTRFEETDPAVIFTGTWSHGNTALAWSGGTASLTNTPPGEATFTFTGTHVSWISFRGPNAGIANVYVDGTLTAEVDLYAPAQEVQAVAFTSSGLTAGEHTLTIEVTGSKNVNSSDSFVVVDAFDVTP